MDGRIVGIMVLALVLGACGKTYGTSDSEIFRQANDLTREALNLRCLSPETRGQLEEALHFENRNPNIEKRFIESIKIVIREQKQLERSGRPCHEIGFL